MHPWMLHPTVPAGALNSYKRKKAALGLCSGLARTHLARVLTDMGLFRAC